MWHPREGQLRGSGNNQELESLRIPSLVLLFSALNSLRSEAAFPPDFFAFDFYLLPGEVRESSTTDLFKCFLFDASDQWREQLVGFAPRVL